MTNLIEILKWSLIVVLLGVACLFGVKSCNSDKKNVQLSTELLACQNAPIVRDTIHDTITIVEYKYIKPTPKPKPNDNTGLPPTAVTKCSDITSVYYSDVFKKEGVEVSWEAFTGCSNDSSILSFIRFPKITYPKETIVETKTVIDSIPVEVPAILKSKFGFYGGVGAKNFKEFPVVEAGAMYLHKQSWGLQGGAMYFDKSLYGTIKIFVTL